MRPGTHVITPHGRGVIVYVRMTPPTYAEPEAYSVRLDARRHDPRYSGSIFPAAAVQANPLSDLANAIEAAPKVAEAPFTLSGGSVPRHDGTQANLFKEKP